MIVKSDKLSGASYSSDLAIPAEVGEETIPVPEEKVNESDDSRRLSESYARSRKEEIKFNGNYVEATLRQGVGVNTASQKSASAASLNGLRIGWEKDGTEVKVTRALSPAEGHATRMDAIAYARLTGANPAAVVQDRDGKWHAVELNRNFHGGTKLASDNNLRQVEGLTGFDPKAIAGVQKEIEEARAKGDYEAVSKLQKHKASLIFGVPESEINFIRNSSDRLAGKININAGSHGGGMHGAEKAPNTNFDPARKNAMEISANELDDLKNAPAIIHHENSHAKDYALTQNWIQQYEKETGKKFVPGDKGDQSFTIWINQQASAKRLSRADAELISDVSANANGSTEAKAYVGTFINALKAGNPEAATAQLKAYAGGMLSRPQKINRPTGAHVELELKRQLETEYRNMPKEMQKQFDQIFADLAKTYPDAWVSKFNHATALRTTGE